LLFDIVLRIEYLYDNFVQRTIITCSLTTISSWCNHISMREDLAAPRSLEHAFVDAVLVKAETRYDTPARNAANPMMPQYRLQCMIDFV
jgi:hypothetical protein